MRILRSPAPSVYAVHMVLATDKDGVKRTVSTAVLGLGYVREVVEAVAVKAAVESDLGVKDESCVLEVTAWQIDEDRFFLVADRFIFKRPWRAWRVMFSLFCFWMFGALMVAIMMGIGSLLPH